MSQVALAQVIDDAELEAECLNVWLRVGGESAPGHWTRQDCDRAAAITGAQVERTNAEVAFSTWAMTVLNDLPESSTLDDAIRLGVITETDYWQRLCAIPAPDLDGLRWLRDEYVTAEREGTLRRIAV